MIYVIQVSDLVIYVTQVSDLCYTCHLVCHRECITVSSSSHVVEHNYTGDCFCIPGLDYTKQYVIFIPVLETFNESKITRPLSVLICLKM